MVAPIIGKAAQRKPMALMSTRRASQRGCNLGHGTLSKSANKTLAASYRIGPQSAPAYPLLALSGHSVCRSRSPLLAQSGHAPFRRRHLEVPLLTRPKQPIGFLCSFQTNAFLMVRYAYSIADCQRARRFTWIGIDLKETGSS